MPVYFEIHFFFSPFSSLRRSSLAPCVYAEMYISETSRHVFHSEKGSLHGGKRGGKLVMASYVSEWMSVWQEAEAVVETQLRDVCSVLLWFAVLLSHTHKHEHTVIAHWPWMHYWGWQAEDTEYKTDRARGRKAKLFFVPFLQFGDKTLT